MEPLVNQKQIRDEVLATYYNDKRFCFPVLRKNKYKKVVVEGELVDELISSSPIFQPELFKFSSTHEFNLNVKEIDAPLDDFENNPTFFLLQVIGYVSGYRVMPSSFWFD